MNILLSSAGRRNYLARYFRDALKGRGRILAADVCGDAPALKEADVGFVVPPFTSESYVDTLIGICQEHDVRLMVPLNEFELPVMARAASRFLREAGVTVLVSDPGIVEMCLDKLASLAFLERQSILVPKTYADLASANVALARGELSFPVIVKPRWGSGSIGLFVADSASELDTAVKWCQRAIRSTILASAGTQHGGKSVLIQEKLTGAEYGFDVVNDLRGRHVCTLSRMKLTTWGGEADRAITVHDRAVEELGKRIGSTLGHLGMLDVDAILTERGLAVLDLNPRFGGSYPFSHAAGADIPSAILAWARQKEPDVRCFQYTPGIVTAKTLELSTSSAPRAPYASDVSEQWSLVEA